MTQPAPTTLGELRATGYRTRTVRDELRDNLIGRIGAGEDLFPGIHGYEDSVVPQLTNAILSRHDFILLGLRGQAKSRILRQLVGLLDPHIPVIAGSEVNDDPLAPISKHGRMMIEECGDATPIEWLAREQRYLEKLATPDVTIADIIGDLDPIKAARGGHILSDELTIHYGMLPRANRGIFAMNELPDLSPRIQVGLFNILEEGDVQIKGYPVRLPLDLLIAFTANPEDYTARGKIVTPLKDRIAAEIRTHYPQTSRRRWPSPNRRRGCRATDSPSPSRRSCARSSSGSRCWRAWRTGSTRPAGSASACRSRSWRRSCRARNGARSFRAKTRRSRASATSTPLSPP